VEALIRYVAISRSILEVLNVNTYTLAYIITHFHITHISQLLVIMLCDTIVVLHHNKMVLIYPIELDFKQNMLTELEKLAKTYSVPP
jgi:hypothetical protein